MSKPSLEQLKKQAKELVRGHAGRVAKALAFIRAHHPAWTSASDDEIASGAFQLSDAQWAIARSLGDASWPAVVHRLAEVPLVPVRNIVVFPGQRVTLHIGRPRSKGAIEAALRGDGVIALVAQRAADTEQPQFGDLHGTGTLSRVLSVQPATVAQVQVEGLRRVRVVRIDEREGMLVAETRPIAPDDMAIDPAVAKQAAVAALDAIARQLPQLPVPSEVRALILPHVRLLPIEVQQQMLDNDDPAQWVHALAAALNSALAPLAKR
jgi:Lon protease-like protein